MSSTYSPMDFIRPYKEEGLAVLVWKNPRDSDPRTEEFAARLNEKGFKAQTLVIPEPPEGFPKPPYYPDLTLTILDASVADVVLDATSNFLKVYQGMSELTVKIDIVLDKRVVSAEANGTPMDVGKTLRSIPKIEKLSSSNLVIMITDQELTGPVPKKFCSKCGTPIPTQSEYCYSCGQEQ
ncbi:MAG: zinc ribbon domain-containing protein [Candidatus Bathyarchaeota archaeon]|jgi:hypothetical protein|nr:zinc ribbon domain-containing protein [Candidatus Bathyarchaeota archaeon]